MTRNAELQVSAFLKDGTIEWHALKLVWLGRGRQDYLFWGVFQRERDLTAERLIFSLSFTGRLL